MSKKIRVYTETFNVGNYLARYLYWHPALYDFIDWELIKSTIPRKNPRTIPPWKMYLPLTNGTVFVLGPERPQTDLGFYFDKYAMYDTSYSVPLDILLLVLEEGCKDDSISL